MQPEIKTQHQLMEELAELRTQMAELEALVMQGGLLAKDSKKPNLGLGVEEGLGGIEKTIEAVPEGILVVGDDGRIMHINGRAESLFGYSHDELLGKPIELLLPERLHGVHNKHRRDYLLESHTRPMAEGLDLVGRRRDGSDIPLQIGLGPVESEGRRLVVAIVAEQSKGERARSTDVSEVVHLLRTKLHRPQVPLKFVSRSRLLERLNQPLNQPLTLVSASAGYGKTSLVSDWFDSLTCPVGWLSLDEQDSDFRTFLAYFLNCIQTMFPDAVGETAALLNIVESPSLPVMVDSLINELDHLPQPFVLALDDYHVIHDSQIDDLLTKLLDHPPRPMHLVLITRTDPLINLASLRAKAKVREFRTHDLRFSVSETSELLGQLLNIKVDEEVTTLLHEKTEGWVAGMRLAALSIRHQDDIRRVILGMSGEQRYVWDYLFSEVLNTLSPDLQDYLIKTAILDRLNGPLCDALIAVSEAKSGKADLVRSASWRSIREETSNSSQAILESLLDANLFIVALDGQQQWYRYHHLFQQLLIGELNRRFTAAEIAALHSQAGAWFAQNGLIEEALKHALTAGDTSTAVQLVARHRHDLMNREQWVLLSRWTRMIPPQIAEEELEILLAKAWVSHNQSRASELDAILGRAEELITSNPPEPLLARRLQAEIDVLRSYQSFLALDAPAMIRYAQRALPAIPPEWSSVRALATIELAYANRMTGDSNKAYHLLHDALQTTEPSHLTFHGRLMLTLCLLHWHDADLPEFGRTATQYLKFAQENHLPEGVAFAQGFLGSFHYQRNELAEAERYLVGATSTPRNALTFNIVQSSCTLALTFQALGKPNRALRTAESIEAYLLHIGSAGYLPVIGALQAELAMRQGHPTVASHWAQKVDTLPPPMLHREYVPQVTLIKAFSVDDTEASRQQAIDKLAQLQGFVERVDNVRYQIEVFALQSLIDDAQGNEQAAMNKVEQAIHLAEPGGWIRLFVDHGPGMASLLQKLQKQDVALDYIGQILDAFEPGEHQPLTTDHGLAEPLTDRELEVLGLLKERLSNKEIASQLIVSANTVRQHNSNIYRKLQVNTRRKAVSKAIELEILLPD